jgi:hypothetical protein
MEASFNRYLSEIGYYVIYTTLGIVSLYFIGIVAIFVQDIHDKSRRRKLKKEGKTTTTKFHHIEGIF